MESGRCLCWEPRCCSSPGAGGSGAWKRWGQGGLHQAGDEEIQGRAGLVRERFDRWPVSVVMTTVIIAVCAVCIIIIVFIIDAIFVVIIIDVIVAVIVIIIIIVDSIIDIILFPYQKCYYYYHCYCC